MTYIMDPRLEAEGEIIAALNLSHVILVNNKLFPWIILVPSKPDIVEIIDLDPDDQAELFAEITFISHIMKEVFEADKLNIASLGNKVSQLHVHIIARYEDDSAWPDAPFGKGREIYNPQKYAQIKQIIQEIISLAEES